MFVTVHAHNALERQLEFINVGPKLTNLDLEITTSDASHTQHPWFGKNGTSILASKIYFGEKTSPM